MKKNSCTPVNRKKHSCYGLKKIHTRKLITTKNSCGSKILQPPLITFLMVRPYYKSLSRWKMCPWRFFSLRARLIRTRRLTSYSSFVPSLSPRALQPNPSLLSPQNNLFSPGEMLPLSNRKNAQLSPQPPSDTKRPLSAKERTKNT